MTRSPKGSAGWVSVQGLGRPLLPVGALAPDGPGGTALEEGQAGLPFPFFLFLSFLLFPFFISVALGDSPNNTCAPFMGESGTRSFLGFHGGLSEVFRSF